MIRRPASANTLRRVAGLALAALAWQIAATAGPVPPDYFPPLTKVAPALAELVASPDFLVQTGLSLTRIFAGLCIAVAAGLSLALFAARVPVARQALAPLVDVLRFLPPPAIVPISIFFLGIGPKLFLFIIGFAALWPIYITSVAALSAPEPIQVLTARLFGYSPSEILMRVRLPASLPEVLTGVRIGTGSAVLATIASEMFAGQTGLGYELYSAAFALRTADMFAIMAIIGVLGILLNAFVVAVGRLFVGWHMKLTAMAEPV